MGSVTCTAFGPATIAFVAVLPPYLVVLPYWKYQSVVSASEFLPLPQVLLNAQEIATAAPVATTGAEVVLNEPLAPNTVPAEL